MPEPNATVDPFDSAGIRLPTEGKGYSGTDSATPVVGTASFGSPVPTENAPGVGVIAVDIPFAAGGEVIEVQYVGGMTPDNTNLTPATIFALLVGVVDSALAPFSAFIEASIRNSPNLTIALTDFVELTSITQFEVPDGLTYPLTVFLVYFSDGDLLFGQNQVVGIGPTPVSFRVQRVKRERVLQMPPVNLI